MVKDILTIKSILEVTELTLLFKGGLEDWFYYNDVLAAYGENPYTVDENNNKAFDDASNFLNVLYNYGVNTWDLYDLSLNGLDEYEEYLSNLDSLTDAEDFYTWESKIDKLDTSVKTITLVELEGTLTYSELSEIGEKINIVIRHYGEPRSYTMGSTNLRDDLEFPALLRIVRASSKEFNVELSWIGKAISSEKIEEIKNILKPFAKE